MLSNYATGLGRVLNVVRAIARDMIDYPNGDLEFDETDDTRYSIPEREKFRDTKRKNRQRFLSKSIEEKAKSVRAARHFRYKDRHVPNYIKGQIDLSDNAEVRKWESIDFNSRYPMLGKAEPKTSLPYCTVLFEGGKFMALVYNIKTIGSIVLGLADWIEQEPNSYDDDGNLIEGDVVVYGKEYPVVQVSAKDRVWRIV